ncbi:hypothetical protein XV03_07495, partial [Mycobacterium avium subsp. hominissuis]
MKTGENEARSAQRVVETLHAYGVRYVFGVPGAKIDPVFDALLDSGAELVVCRHEQNAAHAMWDPSTSLCARLGSWRLLGLPRVQLARRCDFQAAVATGVW